MAAHEIPVVVLYVAQKNKPSTVEETCEFRSETAATYWNIQGPKMVARFSTGM